MRLWRWPLAAYFLLGMGGLGCTGSLGSPADAGVAGADAGPGPDSSAALPADAVAEVDAASSPPANSCADWQILHPEWLWCDDFDDGRDLAEKYPDHSSNGMSVSSDDALGGTHALRQHYTAGQVDAGWVSFFYGDTLGGDYGPVQQEVYARWYHKFESGFEEAPPKMARVTSIGPGWDKRFGVYYWIADSEIVADVHVPHSSQANSAGWLPVKRSGFFYSTPGSTGRWICHEMRVKANTPGLTDGAYAFWVDGEKVIDETGVDLVGSTAFNFNNAMLDCYWNGGSPKAQSRFYDNFVVSTQPIGCD